MTEASLNYNEITDHFGEETIRDRYRFLFDKMQEYIKERDQSNNLAVDESILQQAIMDYFADIYRLKIFHKIEHINKAKILAYEVYWILRRKPLQICNSIIEKGKDDQTQKLVFANEGFSVTLIANDLLMPKPTVPMSPEKESIILDFLDQLYYHFKYRVIDKQSLETVLYAFDTGKHFAS